MVLDEVKKAYRPLIEKKLELLLDELITNAQSEHQRLYFSSLKEFILRGGKRLRPLSLLMVAKGFDDSIDEDSLINASLSVELLHNGTLAHDDVMDNDELRRGGPTLWTIFKDLHKQEWGGNSADAFGKSIAILQGNTLTTLAFRSLLDSGLEEDNVLRAVRALNNYYDTVNAGQLLDMLMEKQGVTGEDEYLRMVHMKTGALFEASLVVGALLGNAGDEGVKRVSDYASMMGQAFQIQDDILGSFGSKEFGKPTDSDIREGKRTLLVIKAFELASEEDRKTLASIIGKQGASAEEVETVRKMMRECGALDYCKRKARELVAKANASIKGAGMSEDSTRFFIELADYSISRSV